MSTLLIAQSLILMFLMIPRIILSEVLSYNPPPPPPEVTSSEDSPYNPLPPEVLTYEHSGIVQNISTVTPEVNPFRSVTKIGSFRYVRIFSMFGGEHTIFAKVDPNTFVGKVGDEVSVGRSFVRFANSRSYFGDVAVYEVSKKPIIPGLKKVRFGTIAIGQSVEKKILIRNVGYAIAKNLLIRIGDYHSDNDLQAHIVSTTCGDSLEVGASCIVRVSLSPTAPPSSRYPTYLRVLYYNQPFPLTRFDFDWNILN